VWFTIRALPRSGAASVLLSLLRARCASAIDDQLVAPTSSQYATLKAALETSTRHAVINLSQLPLVAGLEAAW